MIYNIPMENKQPLVTVIITNYNYGKYIKQAIESVLTQVYSNIELIIIDDGSTDNSIGIIEDLVNIYPKIQLYKQQNKGIVPTRNRGLKLAKGEYLMFLDADDTIPEDYVSSMVRVAEKGYDVVYSNIMMFGNFTRKIDFSEFDIEKLKLSNFVNSAALIRRSSIGSRKFDIKLNRKTYEDYDFFLGLALAGLKFKKANTVLNYRMHGQSRNENEDDPAKRISDFLKVYEYIINKYQIKYPTALNDQFNKGLLFHFTNLYKTITKQGEEIMKLHIEEKKLQSIINSKSYKIGRVITKPYRILRRLIKNKIRE